MGKHNGLPARRRGSSRTVYITATVAGLFVGISAWTMSHAPAPAAPTVVFGTAAETSRPSGSPIPTGGPGTVSTAVSGRTSVSRG